MKTELYEKHANPGETMEQYYARQYHEFQKRESHEPAVFLRRATICPQDLRHQENVNLYNFLVDESMMKYYEKTQAPFAAAAHYVEWRRGDEDEFIVLFDKGVVVDAFYRDCAEYWILYDDSDGNPAETAALFVVAVAPQDELQVVPKQNGQLMESVL